MPDQSATQNTHSQDTMARLTRGTVVVRWAVILVAGSTLTYATRYFLNGDALNYIEMGERFSQGEWSALVNFTESPLYPFLLGIAYRLLDIDRLNEVPMLKVVNFVCLILAGIAFDLFLSRLRINLDRERYSSGAPLPFALVACLLSSVFLFVAFAWVRVRLVAPDMLVLACMPAIMTTLLWIRERPDSYKRFALLGLLMGLAYLTKSFFFVFSVIIIVLAWLCAGLRLSALPRLLVTVTVMLAVASPLIASLSAKVGRFSYSEVGTYGYTRKIAGAGKPIHPPVTIHAEPKVLLYRDGPGRTYPEGFDIAYWTIGKKPVLDVAKQVSILVENVGIFLGIAPGLLVLIVAWFMVQAYAGGVSIQGLHPRGLPFLFLLPAAAGIGIYCLLHVEERYLAAFLLLAWAGLCVWPRYDWSVQRTRQWAKTSCMVATGLILFLVAQTAVDQAFRGLSPQEGKQPYQALYREHLAIKDYLEGHGIQPGAQVAVVGEPLSTPILWARLAGIRIVARAPSLQGFVNASPAERRSALRAMQDEGIDAVLSNRSALAALRTEGWRPIPGTADFWALLVNSIPGSYGSR